LGTIGYTAAGPFAGFALAAIFVVWWAAAIIVRAPAATRRRTAVLAVTAAAAFTVWFLVVARPAASYIIAANIEPDVKQLVQIAEGHMPVRQLYADGGAASPEWWMLAGFAAIGLIIVALLAGLRRAWTLLRGATDRAPLLAVAAIAACYPLTLLPRLTVPGGALSSRTSEYIYAALGCVIGLLLTQDLAQDKAHDTAQLENTTASGNTALLSDTVLQDTVLPQDTVPLQRIASPQETVRQTAKPLRGRGDTAPGVRRGRAGAALLAGRWGTVAAVVVIVIVFVGGVTIGNAYSVLLPQPAGVAGYPVSPQPDAIAAAAWVRAHLGPGQPFVATVTDSFALGDAGENPLDGDDTYPVIFSSTLAAATPTIRQTGARYVLVDWQMTMWPPAQGSDGYLSGFEPGAGPAEKPLPIADLAKFTGPCVRLLDTFGPIEVLDVSRIEDGTCTPSLQVTASRSH